MKQYLVKANSSLERRSNEHGNDSLGFTRECVSCLRGGGEGGVHSNPSPNPNPNRTQRGWRIASLEHEQALVCLSNREIVDASRRRPFHCKMANNGLIAVGFSNCVGLIYLANKPPSTITAFGFPPSTLAVEFCYSETTACSSP